MFTGKILEETEKLSLETNLWHVQYCYSVATIVKMVVYLTILANLDFSISFVKFYSNRHNSWGGKQSSKCYNQVFLCYKDSFIVEELSLWSIGTSDILQMVKGTSPVTRMPEALHHCKK